MCSSMLYMLDVDTVIFALNCSTVFKPLIFHAVMYLKHLQLHNLYMSLTLTEDFAY